ncbi:MAG: tandem-95 repeat protein, partial [Planctomycetales bacterium]|nr:tandem-95 repeat protein [Planctomycetales bacterium]
MGNLITTETFITLNVITESGAAVNVLSPIFVDSEIADAATKTFRHNPDFRPQGLYQYSNIEIPFGNTDFTVRVADAAGNTTIEEILVSRNNAPEIADQSFGPIPEGSEAGTVVGTVVATDLDLENGEADEELRFAITAGNAEGAFAIDELTGELTVSNSEMLDFESSPTLTLAVTVSDFGGADLGLSASAQITVSLGNVNEPNEARDDQFETDEDTAITTGNLITADNGFGADSDIDSDTLFIQGVFTESGTLGTVGQPLVLEDGSTMTVNANGTFTYDPTTSESLNALQNGDSAISTFLYTVSDGEFESEAIVVLAVNGVNDAPTAAADEATLHVNASQSGASFSLDVLLNDFDPDTGDTLRVASFSSDGLAFGSVAVSNSGNDLIYTPNAGVTSGTDTLEYVVTDSQGGTTTGSVNITITEAVVENMSPIAFACVFDTDEDTALSGNFLSDAACDGAAFDPDGDAFVVTEVNGVPLIGDVFALPSGALLIVQSDGAFSYDPNGRFEDLLEADSAVDVFTYTISDSEGATDTSTVTISIHGVNDPPIAEDDSVTVTEDTFFNAIDVLSNDRADPDSASEKSSFRVVSVGTSTPNAQVDVDDDGLFALYTPPPNFFGTDTFTYVMEDSGGAQDSAAVTVVVLALNDPPTANDDVLSVSYAEDGEGSPLEFELDVLANDSFLPDEGETLTILNVFGASALGTARVSDDGAMILYTPAKNSEGESDTFSYVVSDGISTSQAQVTVNIHLSFATDDIFSTNEDTPLTGGNVVTGDNGAGPDLFSGDTYLVTAVNGSDLNIGAAAITAQGANVTVQSDGSFFYDPTSSDNLNALSVGETIEDTFTYTLSDEFGFTDIATVTITVHGVNDAPALCEALADQAATVDQAFQYMIPAAAFCDPDVNGNAPDDSLTLSAQRADGGPLPSWLSFDGATLTGMPTAADVGNLDIRITAADGNGGEVDDVFELSVVEQAVGEMQVELVVRSSQTPEGDFDVFVANPRSDSGSGVGRLEIVDDGERRLDYILTRLEGFDFDGTKTPSNASDNVQAVELRDGSNVLFNIPFANGNDTNELLGSWSAGQGFDQAAIDALHGRSVSIHIVTAGGSTQIGGLPFLPSPEVQMLPASLSSVNVGESYVVEVWARDNDPSSRGVSSLNLDVLLNGELSSPSGGASQAVEVTDEFAVGRFEQYFENNPSSGTDTAALTGGLLFQGVAVTPHYVRFGTIFVDAAAAGVQTYDLQDVTAFRIGNGTALPSDEVIEFDVSVEHVDAGDNLVGEEVAPVDGAALVLGVVETPSALVNGQRQVIPASVDFIDEWDTHYAEVWVRTSEAAGVDGAAFDLQYNGAAFTATNIEYGPLFAGAQATIDDAAGAIRGMAATAFASGAGGEAYA